MNNQNNEMMNKWINKWIIKITKWWMNELINEETEQLSDEWMN